MLVKPLTAQEKYSVIESAESGLTARSVAPVFLNNRPMHREAVGI